MNEKYKLPRNEFEIIEKFDSYDDNLAINMVKFYQRQRDGNTPLKEAYIRTLQVWDNTYKSNSKERVFIND